VPSLKIDSNALDAMRNVGAYVEGVATATRSFDIDKEIGQAITTIAKVSLGKFIDSDVMHKHYIFILKTGTQYLFQEVSM